MLRVLWVPVVIAAGMHMGLLVVADRDVGTSQPLFAATAVQVRALPEPREVPATKPKATQLVQVQQPVTPRVASFTAPAPPPSLQRDETLSATAAPVEAAPSSTDAPRELASIAIDADLVKTIAAPAGTTETTLPVYRTVMPPAATMHYELRKGFVPGSGELVWKPAADRYEARLEGSVAGMNLLTQTSIGVIDANGLAPLRYTDARSRRGTSAANFQRDKGKITFSGPQVEYPMLPGAQDRVSWMIQIGAILNADPKLAAPDAKILMQVCGAAGDVDIWVFRFVGVENVRTDSGVLRTVKFTREPRKAYDRSVEVWLAPARNHLPVRARFTANAGGDAFELLLRDIRSP